MKEALFWEKEDKKVHCLLCPKNCKITEGKRGFCKVRKNVDGILYSLVYGKPCSIAVDPIEKKPLFHFIPSSLVYSVGTAGCNLSCKFCQNYQISQSNPEDIPCKDMSPEDIVNDAIQQNCKAIAYTYNEPTIFFEYALDIAKLARKKGLKNIMVTNGYINEKPLKQLYKYIDAVNVDLKAFTERFYKDMTLAGLKPVLKTLKLLNKMNVWIEITNLIIPTLNDNEKEIKNMCEWIVKNLGKDVPLHFSAFYPCYKLLDIKPTPIKTLEKAHKIAKEAGLNYVYVGNVESDLQNTFCDKCNNIVIERTRSFDVNKINIKEGKCTFCSHLIKGVF